MNICSIDGCEKYAVARTWCHAHYKKWSLHGCPTHGTEHARKHGEGTINYAGYIAVSVGKSKKMQHVIVMEQHLGHPLKKGNVVHHIDGDTTNNDISNLQLFQNQSEHRLFHANEKAMMESGNPTFRKCIYCKAYDDPANMKRYESNINKNRYHHVSCKRNEAKTGDLK